MNKENNKLITEIAIVIIIMIIAIPICANASSKYNRTKEKLETYNIQINITNNSPTKIITLNNYNKNKTRINLVLKISKFSDEYLVKLDNNTYNLNSIAYTEDADYYYYNLGNYELNKERTFSFQLIHIGEKNYDDNISYSFLAEV